MAYLNGFDGINYPGETVTSGAEAVDAMVANIVASGGTEIGPGLVRLTKKDWDGTVLTGTNLWVKFEVPTPVSDTEFIRAYLSRNAAATDLSPYMLWSVHNGVDNKLWSASDGSMSASTIYNPISGGGPVIYTGFLRPLPGGHAADPDNGFIGLLDTFFQYQRAYHSTSWYTGAAWTPLTKRTSVEVLTTTPTAGPHCYYDPYTVSALQNSNFAAVNTPQYYAPYGAVDAITGKPILLPFGVVELRGSGYSDLPGQANGHAFRGWCKYAAIGGSSIAPNVEIRTVDGVFIGSNVGTQVQQIAD